MPLLLYTNFIRNNRQTSFSKYSVLFKPVQINCTFKRYYPGGNLTKVSGLMDLPLTVRLLFKNKMDPESIFLRKTIAYEVCYFTWTLLRSPTSDKEHLQRKIYQLYTERSVESTKIFGPLHNLQQQMVQAGYTKWVHKDVLKFNRPFHQNLLACTFAGRGLNYAQLAQHKFCFDLKSYNKTNETPLALTTLAEMTLLDASYSNLLYNNPKVKGFFINSDNILRPELQNHFYSLIKQPNPDGYLCIVDETHLKEKILPVDVKLFGEAELKSSTIKGYTSVVVHNDDFTMLQLMKRQIGDIGGHVFQGIEANKYIKETPFINFTTMSIKNLKLILTETKISTKEKFNKVLQLNNEMLLDPRNQTIIPSMFFFSVPNINLIEFINLQDPKIMQELLLKIATIIDPDIIFPTNASGVDANAFENMFLEILEVFPKDVSRDLIDNYNHIKTFLITYD